MYTRYQREGFTLLELLIVAAIVALLAAILLPGLRAARRSAQRTVCQSNLAHWARAVMLYADANQRYLPRRGQGAQPTTLLDRDDDWFNALPPIMKLPRYRELIARTPAGSAEVFPGSMLCPDYKRSVGGPAFAYGMNMMLSTWNAAKPDRIDRVAPPAVQVFMADAPGAYCSVLPRPRPYSPVARHDRRVNISFLDGHVMSFTGTYVGCDQQDPNRVDVRWVVPDSSWLGPN